MLIAQFPENPLRYRIGRRVCQPRLVGRLGVAGGESPLGSGKAPIAFRFRATRFSCLFSRLRVAALASVVFHALLLAALHHFTGDLIHGAGNPGSQQALLVSLHGVLGSNVPAEDRFAPVESGAGRSQAEGASVFDQAPVRVAQPEGGFERKLTSSGDEKNGFSREPARLFYPADQLSVRPLPLSDIESPDFDMPMQDRRASVIMDVSISESGEVVSALPVMSGLPESYTQSLAAAFRRLRFTPGEINGVRVGSLLRVELTAENLGLPVQ